MSSKGVRKISTFGSRLTSIVSVCLVLVLLGIAIMIGIGIREFSDDVRRNLGFTIRMEYTAESTQAEQLAQSIDGTAGVHTVEYLSAEQILAAESEALGGDLALEPGINPYCAEIEVKVEPEYANADSIDAIIARYAQAPGVQEIVSERSVIRGVENTLERIRIILLSIAIVLLLVSIALINNTVSLSIYSRRFTIHTMKLVGATGSFIRAPFIRAGALNGLIAGIIAGGLLCGARVYLGGIEPVIETQLSWSLMGILCAILLIAGILICALTALFATNRYLSINYDEMFLK